MRLALLALYTIHIHICFWHIDLNIFSAPPFCTYHSSSSALSIPTSSKFSHFHKTACVCVCVFFLRNVIEPDCGYFWPTRVCFCAWVSVIVIMCLICLMHFMVAQRGVWVCVHDLDRWVGVFVFFCCCTFVSFCFFSHASKKINENSEKRTELATQYFFNYSFIK